MGPPGQCLKHPKGFLLILRLSHHFLAKSNHRIRADHQGLLLAGCGDILRLRSPFAPAPGLAIEPQNYPNAINIPSMPSPILRPGETYSERQFFAFKW